MIHISEGGDEIARLADVQGCSHGRWVSSPDCADICRGPWGAGLRLNVRLSAWGKTKPACSRTAALAMAFKLVESAQQWWAVNAPHLVALVRAGARFERGQLVELPPPSRHRV